MKNKILIFALFILVLGAVAFGVSRNIKTSDKNNILFVAVNQKDEKVNLETITLSSETSTNFNGVKMKIYKNSYGYEIKYPLAWHELGLPGTYGNQKDMDTYRYFSPHPINEELSRFLLKPIGCEGEEDGCTKYFSKYQSKDYSMIEIYAQGFDHTATLPDVRISDASKKHILFPDKTDGVIWTQNAGKIRFVIIDDEAHKYQYRITIRDPREFGLDFTKDILPIISTFRLTGQFKSPESPTQPNYPKEEVNTKIKTTDVINPVETNTEPVLVH